MKRIFPILLLLGLLSAYTFAQNPVWSWVQTGGGILADQAFGITTDAMENAFVCGNFHDTAQFGTTTLVSDGAADGFLIKYNGSGTLQWSLKFGGPGDQTCRKVILNSSGAMYVIGVYDHELVAGNIHLTSAGEDDIFLAKVSKKGVIQWIKRAGGVEEDEGINLAVDKNNNVVVIGSYEGTIDFGTTTLNSQLEGSYNLFVAKYSGSGSLKWVTPATVTAGTWKGKAYVTPRDIVTDINSNCYVVGELAATASFGSSTLYASEDMFFFKLDHNGVYQWSKIGCENCYNSSIEIDGSQNLYTSGSFGGYGLPAIIDGDIYINTINDYLDTYVAKWNSSGEALWAKTAGGNYLDFTNQMAVSAGGDIYVTGVYTDENFSFGSTTLVNQGEEDMFVAKYNAEGEEQWAVSAGGIYADEARDMALAPSGNLYVAGQYNRECDWGSINVDDESEKYNAFTAKITGNIAKFPSSESKASGAAEVFPNPVSHQLSFVLNEKGTYLLTIYNSEGKVMNEESMIIDEDFTNTIDVEELNPGIYFFRLVHEDGIFTGKFLKE